MTEPTVKPGADGKVGSRELRGRPVVLPAGAELVHIPPPSSLAEALAILQTRLPTIKKGTEGQVGTRKYQYADLADVSKVLLPIMGELGLSFSAKPTWVTREVRDQLGGIIGDTREFVLVYKLRHVSGESDDGEYPLVKEVKSHQDLGSAITYGRRYCLCAITGAVADEDDDGQRASTPAAELIEQARAMRRKDPEVDEHGAATVAEQTRMITGPEPGTYRLPTTPPDDLWLDSPPGKLPPPTGRTPRTSKAQQIIMHFERLGVDDKSVRLGYTARLAGLDSLRTTNDLTAQQGIDVERKLASCRDAEALGHVLGLLKEGSDG